MYPHQARGNLFSFSLPCEDIEARCKEANNNWSKATKAVQASIALPHTEEVLATLVNVHIVGGTKDLVEHLAGATIGASRDG